MKTTTTPLTKRSNKMAFNNLPNVLLAPLTQSQLRCISILIIASFIGTATASIDISQINVNDIQQQLPAEFANVNFTLDDAKKLIRDKCIEVAGEENGAKTYENIESSSMGSIECITNIVNYTAIQEEITKAKPDGELDEVFNKYCNKRTEALECVEKFNEKFMPCLDEDEQKSQEMIMRIVRSLLNFVCYKGGNQIALFIAEKGPECLESKREGIEQCINSTFSSYMPKDGVENIKKLPKFVMGQQQCDDIDRLQKCVVDLLDTCDEITPANIVDSMIKFVKNETMCRNNLPATGHYSSSAKLAHMPVYNILFASVLILIFGLVKHIKL